MTQGPGTLLGCRCGGEGREMGVAMCGRKMGVAICGGREMGVAICEGRGNGCGHMWEGGGWVWPYVEGRERWV